MTETKTLSSNRKLRVNETGASAAGSEVRISSDNDNQKSASTGQRALLLITAAFVIVVDHLSKLFIEVWLPLNQSWSPLPEAAPYFRITHVSNTGAAFGLFPGGSPFFTIIAFTVAVVIIFYNYGLPGGNFALRFALGLQLGGALGNLIDRLRLGHVTDFLDFGPWPVFNLADASIVAGVIILGIVMLREQQLEHKQHPFSERDLEPMDQSGLKSLARAGRQSEPGAQSYTPLILRPIAGAESPGGGQSKANSKNWPGAAEAGTEPGLGD